MSQVSASEHGPVCSRRGYADRGLATLFNAHTYAHARVYKCEGRREIPTKFHIREATLLASYSKRDVSMKSNIYLKKINFHFLRINFNFNSIAIN